MGSVLFSDGYSVSGIGASTQSIRVHFSETYDTQSNSTTVRITLVEMSCSRTLGNCPAFGTVMINGTAMLTLAGSPGNIVNIGAANSFRSISNSAGGTIVIPHDELGAAAMTVSLADGQSRVFGAMYSSKMFGVRTTASKSVSLTAHPRASTIASCTSSVDTLGNLLLSISRNEAAFYHKASFSIGGTALYTSGAFATTLSYTVPRSWFSSYPSATSLTVCVSVQTYTDESCTSAVGSPATSVITVNADAGMKPKLSSDWVSLSPYNTGAVAGITGYVRGYSQAEAVFDPEKIDLADTAGAAIASFSVSCQGLSALRSPYRTGVLSELAPTVVCSVTDTRGRSASESFTLAVMDYEKPALSALEVFRCRADGTADESGTYYSVSARVSFSPLGGENACTPASSLAPSGGSYGEETALVSGTPRLFGTIAADESYTVRIRAGDRLGGSAVYFATIPTRKWAMKFRANGRGVAFGKAAETDDVFEVSSDWTVKFGTPLGIASGGTGADNAADARGNLGLGSVANERQYSAQNPPPYPVTSVNGQTGDIAVSCGGGADLLWTNPSPSSSFAAQSVAVDLSGYSFFAVVVRFHTSGTATMPLMLFTVDGQDKLLAVTAYTSNRTGGRTMVYDAGQQELRFGAATYNGAANNAYAIPFEIWGVNF